MLTIFNYMSFFSRVKMQQRADAPVGPAPYGMTVVERGIQVMKRITDHEMMGTIDEWIDYGAALAIGSDAAHNSTDYGKWIVSAGLDGIPRKDRSVALSIYRDRDLYNRAKIIGHWGADRAPVSQFRIRLTQVHANERMDLLNAVGTAPVNACPLTIPDVADIMNRLAIVYGMVIYNEKASDILVSVIDRLSISTLDAVKTNHKAN
jgi:hypothetical protein